MAASIDSHTIGIDIDANGNAHVTEAYSLNLSDDEALKFDELRNRSSATSEAWMWSNINPEIDMHVLGERSSIVIIAQSEPAHTVTIDYNIPNFARIITEEGRFVTRGIFIGQLAMYDAVSGLMHIPASTTLKISVAGLQVPRKELLKDYFEVRPDIPGADTTLAGDKVQYTLKGELAIPELTIAFKEEKAIGESWGIERLVRSIGGFFMSNMSYNLVLVIIVILVVIYRKEIFGLVTESFGGEQEIEPPRKEK
jgi:hypothetical protein